MLGLNYPPERTGIAPYTGAMARGIASRNYETAALVAHPHYPAWQISPGYGAWTQRTIDDGVQLTRLLHYVPRQPSGVRRAFSELTFGLRQAFHRWGGPDAIVAVSPALISTAVARTRAALLNRKTPFVVWVQDLYSLGLSETGQSGGAVLRVMRMIEGLVLRRATRVIVIHDRFARRVHEDFGVPMDRITVIRNWTHLASAPGIDRSAARARLGWKADETIVLHAGNMGVKQGLDNVIDAGRLAQQDGSAVRFVMLGGGSERERLRALAEGIDNVVFLDALPDDEFSAALQAADVLLVNEKVGVAEMAVPSKLTSYFSAACPVLAATDASGITAEEVRRADAGVVVPAGDPRALLDGALELRADPDSARRLGANGRRFRDTVLDEATAIDAFETLLTQLIDGDDSLLHDDTPAAHRAAR